MDKMEIHEELNRMLAVAFADARGRKHEYLTPEHILHASLFFAAGAGIMNRWGANVELIKRELETYLNEHVPKTSKADPVPSLGFQDLMERAVVHTLAAEKKFLEIGDLYASLLEEKESFGAYLLLREGISRFTLLRVISHADEPGPAPAEAAGGQKQQPSPGYNREFLQLYAHELTEKARDGEIDPLIGREEILERTIQVLCRRLKNNPIHVGEPGVGKTAITEGLAQLIARREGAEGAARTPDLRPGHGRPAGRHPVPRRLRGAAEAGHRRPSRSRSNAILFIDEIHTVVGAGAVSGGSMDAVEHPEAGARLGKGPLHRLDHLRGLPEVLRQGPRPLAAVPEDRGARADGRGDLPDPARAARPVRGATTGCATPTRRCGPPPSSRRKYINDRHLPDKAIDVIDEAGALGARVRRAQRGAAAMSPSRHRRRREGRRPDRPDARDERLLVGERERLRDLEAELKAQIFGQDQAVDTVVRPSASPGPASASRTSPWPRSCSSARPAWARPSSPASSPARSGCRSCAST